MIERLTDDARVILAARLSRMFTSLSPLDVLSLSETRRAIMIAAAAIVNRDESSKQGTQHGAMLDE